MRHHEAFFRCRKRNAVGGIEVRDGLVTRAAPILRVTTGSWWRTTRERLAALGWHIEEMEEPEP